MGSEKKRKRASTSDGVDTPSSLDKSERKRLKKLKKEALENGNPSHEELADEAETITPLVSPIATPMAGRKLTKKVIKVVGRAAKAKALRRGVKEVILSLRKGDRGVVVLAGNVFPVEVIAHIPLVCEEANVPYCYVSSKTELGNASLTKRPTSVVMISQTRAKDEMKSDLEDISKEVAAVQNLY